MYSCETGGGGREKGLLDIWEGRHKISEEEGVMCTDMIVVVSLLSVEEVLFFFSRQSEREDRKKEVTVHSEKIENGSCLTVCMYILVCVVS